MFQISQQDFLNVLVIFGVFFVIVGIVLVFYFVGKDDDWRNK
jgi:hypothetical protein